MKNGSIRARILWEHSCGKPANFGGLMVGRQRVLVLFWLSCNSPATTCVAIILAMVVLASSACNFGNRAANFLWLANIVVEPQSRNGSSIYGVSRVPRLGTKLMWTLLEGERHSNAMSAAETRIELEFQFSLRFSKGNTFQNRVER